MPESGIDPATVRKSTAYSVTLLESLVATPLFKALTLVPLILKATQRARAQRLASLGAGRVALCVICGEKGDAWLQF